MILNLLSGRVALRRMNDWLDRTDAEILLGTGRPASAFHDTRLEARLDHIAEVGSGAVYVVSSFSTGDLSLADADLKLVGECGWDQAGHAISGAGDVNGDGTPDLLIGSPY